MPANEFQTLNALAQEVERMLASLYSKIKADASAKGTR
jgi:hypothetical protein